MPSFDNNVKKNPLPAPIAVEPPFRNAGGGSGRLRVPPDPQPGPRSFTDLKNPSDDPRFLGAPPSQDQQNVGGDQGVKPPEAGGEDPALVALRNFIFGGQIEPPARNVARDRVRRLVTGPPALRREFLPAFMPDIRDNRLRGIGAVRYLLSLLGY